MRFHLGGLAGRGALTRPGDCRALGHEPGAFGCHPKPTAAPASAASPVRPVTAYVANSGNGGQGTVTPINTLTGKAGRPIKAGTGPEDIAITPDGKTAYVSCAGSTPPVVVPIRTATNTAGTRIEVGINPRAIGVT
jgi:DNA-binding beta-propeller fold protein YncE